MSDLVLCEHAEVCRVGTSLRPGVGEINAVIGRVKCCSHMDPHSSSSTCATIGCGYWSQLTGVPSITSIACNEVSDATV